VIRLEQITEKCEKMLSKLEHNILSFYLKIFCKIGLIPFEWNTRELNLTKSKFRWKSLKLKIEMFLTIGIFFYTILRVPETLHEQVQRGQFDKTVLHSMLILHHFSRVIMVNSIILHMDGGIVAIVNQMIAVNAIFGKLHMMYL
jgi:hypothetical protein